MNVNCEYKIIQGNATKCQKVLNQYRNFYNFNIEKMYGSGNDIVILLTRVKKKRKGN